MMISDKSNCQTPSSSENLIQSRQDISYSPTEKKNQNESSDKVQQKRRRTRKDSEAPREYVCGCGKTYLSYPALYTHTKQKHEGIYQGPIKKSSLTISEDANKGDSESDSIHSLQTQDILIGLATRLQPEGKGNGLRQNDVNDLIYWEIQLDLVEAKNGNRRLILSNYYNELMIGLECQNEKEVGNANSAFIQFIRELRTVVNFEQMKQVFLFIYIFRRMLNERSGQEGLLEECESVQAKDLVENANIFICHHLNKIVNKIQDSLTDRNWIVDIVKQKNLENTMIQVMIGFCEWLYAHHLTDDKLVLKQSI